MKILVTGSLGLVGRALCTLLESKGHHVVEYDLQRFELDSPQYEDILDFDKLQRSTEGCNGIVHLAGVSRVIWGYREPRKCWQYNVFGTKNIVNAALSSAKKPWILFASSREVYGQQDKLPVRETDVILSPKNIYARSKLLAEEIIFSARENGLKTGVVRLSSVYGDMLDHHTRVVPAFVRGAVSDGVLSVEGRNNILDFTHVSDVVNAIHLYILALQVGELFPAVHLVTGKATSLFDLAKLAIKSCSGCKATVKFAPSRTYDVERFFGCPALAKSLLGWEAQKTIDEGVKMMIEGCVKAMEPI